MATYAQHIAARNDQDLSERFIAAAEVLGIQNAKGWVEANVGSLVAQDVASGQTISDVHAYAVASYAPVPRPGEDPTKVTDDQITAAVTKIKP